MPLKVWWWFIAQCSHCHVHLHACSLSEEKVVCAELKPKYQDVCSGAEECHVSLISLVDFCLLGLWLLAAWWLHISLEVSGIHQWLTWRNQTIRQICFFGVSCLAFWTVAKIVMDFDLTLVIICLHLYVWVRLSSPTFKIPESLWRASCSMSSRACIRIL